MSTHSVNDAKGTSSSLLARMLLLKHSIPVLTDLTMAKSNLGSHLESIWKVESSLDEFHCFPKKKIKIKKL